MNSPPTKPDAIRLVIRGMGHAPSFKNSKEIVRLPYSSLPTLITKPAYQRWMKTAVASLESQLRCFFRTRGIAIQTVPQPQSLIALWLPLDDSCKWIGTISVNWQRVKKGEEGAELTITPL